MTTVLHVTRLPPSPSGVALYARDVEVAYRLIGELAVHRMPADPRESQKISILLRTWRALRRAVPRASHQVISIELAGRGVAEMWTAWLLARGGRRVWVTVHDIPTLCGPAFLFRSLDRRGGRRIALLLSRGIGRRVERALLQRAELVMSLSQAGSNALRAAYSLDREVLTLPHVLVGEPANRTENRILVPGYVGAAASVIPLIRLLPRLDPPWRLVVGAAHDDVVEKIRAVASESGVADRVETLGFVDEAVLDDEFARASIVVRWRPDGWLSGPADYAVSGPLIRALGRGCAVVTNDRRGIAECLAAAHAIVVRDREEGLTDMIDAVLRLAHDSALRQELADAGLEHIAADHAPAAVAHRLERAIP